jgi:hypothetical protein
VLGPLIALRVRNPLVRERLYCSRELYNRPVTANGTFRQAVCSLADRNFKQLVLSWLTQRGPFWDDERQSTSDDYFEYQGEDVTNQGLGEAARRQLAGINAWTFSFTGSRFGFMASLLCVQHGLAEAPLGFAEVGNHWTVPDLEQASQSARPEPRTWGEVITEAQMRFGGLKFANTIEDILQRQPFNKCVADSIFDLLKVLNRIVEESNEREFRISKGYPLGQD